VGVPQGKRRVVPITYDPDAAGGVSALPNPLTNVMDFITNSQALGGHHGPERLHRGRLGPRFFAAVWPGAELAGGRGRLSLGLTTLWFRCGRQRAGDREPLRASWRGRGG
jgi:hypothetical protein